MHPAKSLLSTLVLFTSLTAPALAFMDEMVAGLTSVTNNLIDSTENVTNNTVNTSAATLMTLSADSLRMADRIGTMADRIGVMADRIGIMADRIVTTEAMLAGLAHKIVDRGNGGYQDVGAVTRQPQGTPWTGQQTSAETLGQNAAYSASTMLYGYGGATYTGARLAPAPIPLAPAYQREAQKTIPAAMPYAPSPAFMVPGESRCLTSYGVKTRC